MIDLRRPQKDLNGSRKKARKTDEESEDQDQEDYEDLELGEPDASESTQSSLPRLSRPMVTKRGHCLYGLVSHQFH